MDNHLDQQGKGNKIQTGLFFPTMGCCVSDKKIWKQKTKGSFLGSRRQS